MDVKDLPNTKCIKAFIHCSLCLAELPRGTSPQEYARFDVGWTPEGLQIWCTRHDCNVLHVHFEGQKHPANTTRKRLRAEKA